MGFVSFFEGEGGLSDVGRGLRPQAQAWLYVPALQSLDLFKSCLETELNLQNFDSLMDKCRSDFQRQIHACDIHACDNGIIQHFVFLHLM